MTRTARPTPAFQDILFRDGVATVTINRPAIHDAVRPQTCEEMIGAFNAAAWDDKIGVIAPTGAGTRAFCAGGDRGDRDSDYSGRGAVGPPAEELHRIIRDAPKPVIGKVRVWRIRAGNVFATLCDLTLASDDAVFGQAGPAVGSVEPGFGLLLPARAIGRKRAKEMWFLRVKAVAPGDELVDALTDQWRSDILRLSPTARHFQARLQRRDGDDPGRRQSRRHGGQALCGNRGGPGRPRRLSRKAGASASGPLKSVPYCAAHHYL